MQTLVSVGPYRFQSRASGQSCLSWRKGADRKDLAGKEHQARRHGTRTIEPPVPREQGQDRGGRVPDRDAFRCEEIAQQFRLPGQTLTNHDQGRRVAAGDEEIEDRQVKVKRCMGGEAIVVGPGTEGLHAPVQKGKGVRMRKHHALGLSGRARGEEDVREVVRIAARSQWRRCIVGQDLGPVRTRPRHRRGVECQQAQTILPAAPRVPQAQPEPDGAGGPIPSRSLGAPGQESDRRRPP